MKSRFGPLTAATIALLAAFGVVDYAAHATGYAHGETFSAFIWQLSAAFWPVRILVGAACLVLFSHLTFRKP